MQKVLKEAERLCDELEKRIAQLEKKRPLVERIKKRLMG